MGRNKGPWEVAAAVLNNRGWKQTSKTIQTLVGEIYKLDRELGGELGNVDSDERGLYDFSMDTHPRSGEFDQMVAASAGKVTVAAKGREIWWEDDENGEYTGIDFFFGTEQEIVERLTPIRDKLKEKYQHAKREQNFVDPMGPAIADEVNQTFGGVKDRMYVVEYSRSDGLVLKFGGKVFSDYASPKRTRVWVEKDGEIVRYFRNRKELDEFVASLPKVKTIKGTRVWAGKRYLVEKVSPKLQKQLDLLGSLPDRVHGIVSLSLPALRVEKGQTWTKYDVVATSAEVEQELAKRKNEAFLHYSMNSGSDEDKVPFPLKDAIAVARGEKVLVIGGTVRVSQNPTTIKRNDYEVLKKDHKTLQQTLLASVRAIRRSRG